MYTHTYICTSGTYIKPKEKNVSGITLRARERVIKLVAIMKRIIPL